MLHRAAIRLDWPAKGEWRGEEVDFDDNRPNFSRRFAALSGVASIVVLERTLMLELLGIISDLAFPL